MKLVYMDGKYDCGAACLATVLGLKGARAAYPMLGYDPNDAAKDNIGTCEEELSEILNTCGLKHTRHVSLEFVCFMNHFSVESMKRRAKLPTEAELHTKLELHKGLAIVSVPKLGDKDYMPGHYVVVQGGVVYDPANKLRYVGSVKSLPVCTVLLIEPVKRKKLPVAVANEVDMVELAGIGGVVYAH